MQSSMDFRYSSTCVWPDEEEIVRLRRVDVFETSQPKVSQLATAIREDSLNFRYLALRQY